MATSNNPYKDLNIDRKSMEQIVCARGAKDYLYEKVGNSFQMSFQLEGVAHKLAVYENKNGSTTLSKLNMDADVFSQFAGAIRDGCGFGNDGRFDVAIPHFPVDSLESLLEYLTEQKVEISRDVTENGYRMLRLTGTQGDGLTIKHFGNRTFQVQGRRAMLASMTMSFLAEVLNHEQAVNAQLDTFAVKVNLVEISKEVEGRLPLSFKRVSEVVRTQLTTAIALSKLDIQLPDYSPVAFPALRGLEGFLKTELTLAGLKPPANGMFGEYFEENPGFGHKMRTMQAQLVGEPVASFLADCYTVFNNERHGIAHLGTEVYNTRTLPDLITARGIVTKVFDSIEAFCSKLH
ncbi:type II toxin-antitoxin system RnlA family toxin [Undibacterium sp.]|uniref:type II toxin-antitoxin system RnlA family toxin n=1 Tax=Undibacterium sp. TaxID=1914977 RepID=UPI0025F87FF8|nr:type II toxin-antitoxin system RnlA family toxin [Undibacterium sp.]